MKAIGINYRNAGVPVRGKLSFSAEERAVLRRKLGASVILCTCNRTEVYFTEADTETVIKLLAEKSGSDISEYLRTYENEGAIRHLFRVASGIDSMVIGEDEILRQVKEAYSESTNCGSTDFELNTVFQAAITAAKRVKTETALSKTPASAATIAANEAAKLGENVNVLMIGASGKIGGSTLKNLLPHANVHITQTARAHKAGTMQYEGVQTVPYDRRYDLMNDADCIISATASPHFTVTADRLKAALKTGKPRLLIDIAVPPDIERSVTNIAGVRLIGIDDLAELAKRGNELRLSAAEQAETIISEELEGLLKKLAFHSFLPKMETAGKAVSALTFDKMIYRLRDGLDSSQFAALLNVFAGME